MYLIKAMRLTCAKLMEDMIKRHCWQDTIYPPPLIQFNLKWMQWNKKKKGTNVTTLQFTITRLFFLLYLHSTLPPSAVPHRFSHSLAKHAIMMAQTSEKFPLYKEQNAANTQGIHMFSSIATPGTVTPATATSTPIPPSSMLADLTLPRPVSAKTALRMVRTCIKSIMYLRGQMGRYMLVTKPSMRSKLKLPSLI